MAYAASETLVRARTSAKVAPVVVVAQRLTMHLQR